MVLIAHWLVMTLWLSYTSSKNNFCNHNSLYDSLFYSIFGAVYIFTHVVLVEGPTFLKYLLFYSILFTENTVANVVWIINVKQDLQEKPFYLPIVLLNIIPFILGILLMLLYYKVFHPSTGYHKQGTHIVSSS